jgi:hypothetical protein
MSEFKPKNDFEDDKYKNVPGREYTWQEVWTMALTRPGVATFEEILRDPQANKERAYKWVFWTGTIGVLVNLIIGVIQVSSIYSQRGYRFDVGAVLPTFGCSLLLGGALVLLFFVIGNVITQFIARMLGGVGGYGEYLYAAAAFSAPLMMVNVAINAFTTDTTSLGLMGLVSLALGIYQLVLMAMAIKAVNQFGWFKTVLTILMPLIIVFVVVFLFVAPAMMSTARF